jgi:hypothetical protein
VDELNQGGRKSVDVKKLSEAIVRLGNCRMPDWSIGAVVAFALETGAQAARENAEQSGGPWGDAAEVLSALIGVVGDVAWGHLSPLEQRRAMFRVVEDLVADLREVLDRTPLPVDEVVERLQCTRDSLRLKIHNARVTLPRVIEFARAQVQLCRQEHRLDDAERIERALAELE